MRPSRGASRISPLALATLALLCVVPSAPVLAAAPGVSLPGGSRVPTRCERVELDADAMSCDKEHCVLTGGVAMRCEDMRLWADELDVQIGEGYTFAGATATGEVLLVQGTTVTTCKKLTIAQDQVRGAVAGATVVIKPAGAKTTSEGLPLGRNTATFSGDIQRESERELVVDNAEFTLCDCGEDPPSWLLRASRVDATLEDRATIWWPVLWIHPVSALAVPITPPLPPLSLPLNRRAFGMLAPQIALYRPPWPMIDIPVFFPLGRSWDVTLIPGVRTDWGKHKLSPPSAWGALRLGSRVRYTPSTTTEGELVTSWTDDHNHGAARALLADGGGSGAACGPDVTDPNVLARCPLDQRLSVDWKHHSEIAPGLDWLVDAEWLSDDLYLTDFKISLADQAVGYKPSRTEVLGRWGLGTAELAADYLLRLNNGGSNMEGAERRSAHRGPYLRLHLTPGSLAPGLGVTADVSFVRYGSWAPDLDPTLMLGTAATSLAYRREWRGLRFAAFGSLDGVWSLDSTRLGQVDTISTAPGPAANDTPLHQAMLLVGASVDTTAARGFGSYLHTVSPQLAYRGVPWQSAAIGTPLPYDERLQRRRFEQAAATVEQTLWRRQGKGLRPLATFELRQPWDLETGRTLQSQARLSLPLADLGTLSSWGSFDWRRAHVLRGIGSSLSVHLGPFATSATYSRWYGDSDALRRSIYELAAPPSSDVSSALTTHILGLSASARWGSRATLSYATAILLKRNDPAADADLPVYNQHVVTVAYRSPCECWSVGVQGQVYGGDAQHTAFEKLRDGEFRLSFTLSIGDYTLGSR